MGTNRKQPFGYKMEMGRVVIDQEEARWVVYIFDQYNWGVSFKKLSDTLNGTGIRYDADKPWNKNMIARILQDRRYIGENGYPQIIEAQAFRKTEEKRRKKTPAIQKTEAQTALRRKCGFKITPYIENEVLYLLNQLAGHPERIKTPTTSRKPNHQLDVLKRELEEMLEQLPVEEERTREKLKEIAVAMYDSIDPREYETQRMKRVFSREEKRTELDADLIAHNIAAVIVDSNCNVKIKLKNEQIIERGE